MTGKEWLEGIKAVATIAASIAIPLVLGHYGHQIQKEISAEGLKKDYVQMAVGILKEQKEGQDAELRRWAVSVIDKNSPVPLTKTLQHQLEGGKVFFPFFTYKDITIDPKLAAEISKKLHARPELNKGQE